MNTKATIIKENVTAERRKEIWEMGKTQKFAQPTIYIIKPTEPTLSIHGTDPLSKYINESEVPTGTSIIRIDANKNSGVVYTDSNTVLVRIFGSIFDILSARREFVNVAIQTLDKYGIKAKLSSHRPGSNDLVVEVDGKEKKFSGSYTELSQSYFSFFITLDFNSEVVKDLYRLDTDKFSARGNILSISDAVCGLREVKSDIDESIVDEIVKSLISKLNYTNPN
jgi:hypothetical protein